MAEKQPLPPRVSISNANLPPGQALLWGADQFKQHVSAIGADGIEWMPIRGRLRAQAELGRHAVDGLVTSLHASFRDYTFMDIARGRAAAKELPFAVAMSRLDVIGPLVVMQNWAGRKLPVVTYPNEQMLINTADTKGNIDFTQWQATFAGVRFQPTAELLHNWGVLSSDGAVAMNGMKEVMAQRGFDGVAFDTHHWVTERGGKLMPDWRDALPVIVSDGTTREMHVCPARPDVGGNDWQLRYLLEGRIGQTEIGDMITCVAESLPDGAGMDFVLELPHVATGGDPGVSREVIAVIRDHFDQAA